MYLCRDAKCLRCPPASSLQASPHLSKCTSDLDSRPSGGKLSCPNWLPDSSAAPISDSNPFPKPTGPSPACPIHFDDDLDDEATLNNPELQPQTRLPTSPGKRTPTLPVVQPLLRHSNPKDLQEPTFQYEDPSAADSEDEDDAFAALDNLPVMPHPKLNSNRPSKPLQAEPKPQHGHLRLDKCSQQMKHWQTVCTANAGVGAQSFSGAAERDTLRHCSHALESPNSDAMKHHFDDRDGCLLTFHDESDDERTPFTTCRVLGKESSPVEQHQQQPQLTCHHQQHDLPSPSLQLQHAESHCNIEHFDQVQNEQILIPAKPDGNQQPVNLYNWIADIEIQDTEGVPDEGGCLLTFRDEDPGQDDDRFPQDVEGDQCWHDDAIGRARPSQQTPGLEAFQSMSLQTHSMPDTPSEIRNSSGRDQNAASEHIALFAAVDQPEVAPELIGSRLGNYSPQALVHKSARDGQHSLHHNREQQEQQQVQPMQHQPEVAWHSPSYLHSLSQGTALDNHTSAPAAAVPRPREQFGGRQAQVTRKNALEAQDQNQDISAGFNNQGAEDGGCDLVFLDDLSLEETKAHRRPSLPSDPMQEDAWKDAGRLFLAVCA